jgi:hypothetical protein
MALPLVEVGGCFLQMWRVAANILNKPSRKADRERSFSLGVGRGVIPQHRKEPQCYEMWHRPSDLAEPYEGGNEHPDSVKGGELLD